MPKWSLKSKLLQLRISTCGFYILCLIFIIQFFVSCGKYNYAFIPREKLSDELYKDVASNLVLKKKIPDCDYSSILQSSKALQSWEVLRSYDDFSPKGIENGSYSPEHCNPQFSVAILVTYRNRQNQLDVFLPYMHNFLRKQNIHYKIYLIEQQDNKNWNKGLLYNVGAKQAISDKFPCLILHDVDLLPLDESNLYACLKQPRHMSASIDKFRYVLTYDWLVGGVLAIRSDQYEAVNGFSNRFEGWGGEDDDFGNRIIDNGFDILRFPREMSRYTMLQHRPEPKNQQRSRILADNRARARSPPSPASDRRPRPRPRPPPADGLRPPPRERHRLVAHKLFTLIAVNL